jgi:mRNA-degrading endonuclease RelE of RelBE toxin-antitoxin system
MSRTRGYRRQRYRRSWTTWRVIRWLATSYPEQVALDKVRLAGRGKGKSGGYRLITYYGTEDVPVFLLALFSKGDRANLSVGECNAIKAG